ncbi:DUF6463 family protein [Spongiactinospora sp. TRM90649]|uniref:DUF6463 family protein n=1 Tax=Spongiactinospora sp. TRM90649 TaxID=3031114 RepID=UPI0023F7EE6D|nr:DUF6463 family protein [Spongiactinospora sp. TRM90649]MDF5754569.1 DUF6463 family protein [Spongiactinospora sp. TRM90649]
MTGSVRSPLRWASGIMLFLGAGHLSVQTLLSWGVVSGWVDRGIWAAVPIMGASTTAALRDAAGFWGGPGSFAVPLILLGCATWRLAARAVPLPAGVGWGLVAWSLISGVILVPSPFAAGSVAGALIIVAARRSDRPSREVPG